MNSFWVKYLPLYFRDSLHGRYNLQKLIGNTGWLFAEKGLRIAVGLVVGVWIARFLGPEQYGLFNFALAFVALFSILGTLGLQGVAVRELVNEPARDKEILGSVFLLKLLGSGLMLLSVVAAIRILRPADGGAQWLVAVIAAGTFFQSFDTIEAWFQARVESRFAVYTKGSAFLLVSALKVFLIISNAPLIAFGYAAAIELVLAAIGFVIVYRWNGQRMTSWTVDAQRVKQVLRDSWPLAFAGMAVLVYMKIDQVMLGELSGDQSVGVYSAAIRISEAWYFIPTSIVASVTPALIEARKLSFDLYYDRMAKLFRLMVLLALGVSAPMTFFSGYVSRLLYGVNYEGVGPVLAIHIWASIFVFLGVAQSPWNINEGLTMLALVRTSIGAVVNILLNLVLIPAYGPVGAAIATIISYALAGVFLNAISSRTWKIFLMQLNSMFLMTQGKR